MTIHTCEQKLTTAQCIAAFETGVPLLTLCLISPRHAEALLGTGTVLALDKSAEYVP